MDLGPFIESTNLDPRILGKDVDKLVEEAATHQIFGICVPPFWVKRAAREIGKNDVSLITVVGFPFGFQMTETKILEAEMAMRDGADEVDVVLHLTSFANNLPWTKIELAKLAHTVHEKEKILKVIIETSLWEEKQMLKAAKMAADAGADFVKTSTGIGTPRIGAGVISLLRRNLPDHVGINASGGIRDRQQAIDLVNAGADRLGTSSAINLV